MKKKRVITRMLALTLTIVFVICNVGIENVAAFWNQDGNNNYKEFAQVIVRLMHCYHKDREDSNYSKHFDSNGNHILDNDVIKQDEEEWLADEKLNENKTVDVKHFKIQPRINNDIAAGTSTYDMNKYIYEYEMSYDESDLVDYALVIHPNITHYSKADAAKSGTVETHYRMYWIGEYQGSIAKLEDKWSEVVNATGKHEVNKPGGGIDWWDFKNQAFPKIDPSLSQQTWETVENMDNQDERTFIMNPDIGDDASNGQRFIYLLEGTYMNKDIGDANHPLLQSTGKPDYAGEHIYGLVGLVFYRSVEFDANGGNFSEGTVRNMQVYNGSAKCKLIPWYSNLDKSRWYSNVNVAAPQVSTQYGEASIKIPTRDSYIFKGWYATPTDSTLQYNDDGTVKCSDVMLYDADGKAVKGTQYFDSSGNWIYKGNVTAYAKWEYVGNYTVHYDKGQSCNNILMPDDTSATLGNSVTLHSGSYVQGSNYTVNFEVYTNNGYFTDGISRYSPADVVQSTFGYFPFRRWMIEGKSYSGGSSYLKADAIKNETVTATAIYSDVGITLPSTTSKGYKFAGWYRSYNPDTQTFDGYVGSAKDRLDIPASSKAVEITLYAKWENADTDVAFDYNIPSVAQKSRLGYVISGSDVKTKNVQNNSPLGALPSPTLTGYRLSTSNLSDGWSKEPNRSDGTQVNVPVNSGTLYDGSYKKLYAQWEPLYYTIKYDLGGGSVSRENPVSASYYNEITVTSPTRTGSTFAGWSISGMDGNKHIIDGSLTGTGITDYSGVGKDKAGVKITGLRADDGMVTLTAVWEDTQYLISYDYRDADSNARLVPSEDVKNPSAYTRNTPTFTLKAPLIKGYTFYAWQGTGLSEKTPSATIQQGSTGNRSYTAYYSPAEYEILYDLSGGSWGTNASHPDSAKYNKTFTVSTPILNGCVFEGWTITGMCDDCSHTVGSSGTAVTETEVSGIKGNTFKNLRCDSSEKVRFKAVWSHVNYSIEYDFNGGSKYSGGNYPSSAETYSSFYITNPVRSGWTFAGWSVSGMDDGIHYLPSGDTSSESMSGVGSGKASGTSLLYGNLRYSRGKVKFTAAWEQDDRQVVFFGNGGTMAGNSVQGDWTIRFIKFGSTNFSAKSEYGTSWGTDTPSMSKTGYNFDGYFDALTGGSQAYNSRNFKTAGLYWDSQGRWIGPSLILYAHFTPKNFKVTFDVNGGYWSSDDTQNGRTLGVTYDSTKNNKAYGSGDIYRPGYTFEGWTTNANGTGYTVYDTDGYSTSDGGYWSENYRK